MKKHFRIEYPISAKIGIALALAALLSIAGWGQTQTAAQTQTAPQTQTQEAPPPSADIYVIASQAPAWKFGKPVNVTARKGYENQPFFLPDGKGLWFTSIREEDQADIYQSDLGGKKLTRLTHTPESEFSPTLTPDGKHFSVVRVEQDQTQRLWRFSLNGENPELILKSIKPVGYHCWVDANHVALFILGEPDTLQLVELGTEKATQVAANPGRSIRLDPRNGRLTFVEKKSEKEWWIREYDLRSGQAVDLLQTLPASEDFAWTQQGTLLMANGSKVYAWNSSTDKDWREIADFSGEGLKSITRLAISPDAKWIALVAQDEESH